MIWVFFPAPTKSDTMPKHFVAQGTTTKKKIQLVLAKDDGNGSSDTKLKYKKCNSGGATLYLMHGKIITSSFHVTLSGIYYEATDLSVTKEMKTVLFHLASLLHKVFISNKEAQAGCFMSSCHLHTEVCITLKKKKSFHLDFGTFFLCIR